MNEEKFMLLFSLGPVQSLIGQARKTRDLWLGSYLLSLLMEASMEGINKQNLIFPDKPVIEEHISDLPNKYIVLFDNKADAVKFADESRKKIETCWNNIRAKVWQNVIAGKDNPYLKDMWDRQSTFSHYFEVFFVVSQKDNQDYPNWLKTTQEAFNARKRLRTINAQFDTVLTTNQNVLDESGEKSTVSGERAALRKSEESSREEVRAFWRELTKNRKISVHDINKEGEERLDAIDTIKRFMYFYLSEQEKGFTNPFSYPSTSSIATATFVESLLTIHSQPNIASALSSWIEITKKLEGVYPSIPLLTAQVHSKFHTREAHDIISRDGDCFFPETFVARRLEKDYDVTDKHAAEQLAMQGQRALKRLIGQTDELGITRPTPYYAMIQMDGDRMGKLLDGVHNEQEHKDISAALSTFSRKRVPDLVEDQYPGRLIYAGGDDVFALAPLARDYSSAEQAESILTVLNLVDRLQQAYHDTVYPSVQTEKRKEAVQVSASAGIAIAHHYTALSYVRRMSKEAEDAAKKHYGRNSLVITVLRRSGEQTRVGCHWSYPGLSEEGQPIKLFSAFYELFKTDILSPKSVHLLLDEAFTLVGLTEGAQTSEIKRVLKRQSDKERYKQRKNSLKEQKKSFLYGQDEFPEKLLATYIVALANAIDKDQDRPDYKEKKDVQPSPSERDQQKQELPEERYAVELHSEERRYGLVEVLGWLLVMAFLARKEQD